MGVLTDGFVDAEIRRDKAKTINSFQGHSKKILNRIPLEQCGNYLPLM